MLTTVHDLRYTLRQLWKDRTVACVVVLTIALGVGVNTAVFSAINGLQRPLPVRAPEEIVVLAADTKGDETGFQFSFSYAALNDFRNHAASFAEVFAFAPAISGLSASDRSAHGKQRIWVRSLDSLDMHDLPGAEITGSPPFWSKLFAVATISHYLPNDFWSMLTH